HAAPRRDRARSIRRHGRHRSHASAIRRGSPGDDRQVGKDHQADGDRGELKGARTALPTCGNNLVPGERIELSWCCHRGILSPVRLPIPPSRQEARDYERTLQRPQPAPALIRVYFLTISTLSISRVRPRRAAATTTSSLSPFSDGCRSDWRRTAT